MGWQGIAIKHIDPMPSVSLLFPFGLDSKCSMGGNSSTLLNTPEADFVRQEVSSNCVVIFSKTYCTYCRATKQLFQNLGATPTVYELDRRQDGQKLQSILGEMTGATSVSRL